MMACLECYCGFIFKVLTFLLGSKAVIFFPNFKHEWRFWWMPRVAGVPGAVLRHAKSGYQCGFETSRHAKGYDDLLARPEIHAFVHF